MGIFGLDGQNENVLFWFCVAFSMNRGCTQEAPSICTVSRRRVWEVV